MPERREERENPDLLAWRAVLRNAGDVPSLERRRFRVRGVVQGDSVPREFIPRLVDLILEGRFPIEKMIKFYDFADINLAAQESSAGIAIKPVLRMPATS